MPPTRHRQSTQSVATPTRRATQTPAPDANRVPNYEPLQNPLNAKAQRDLTFLLRGPGTLGHIKAHLAHAATRLSECVAEANDRNAQSQGKIKNKRERGREIDEETERHAQTLDDKVRKGTEMLDNAMRRVIDMERDVGILEEGVRDVGKRATEEGNAYAARERTREVQRREKAEKARERLSQKRQRVVNGDEEEEEEEEDEDEEDEQEEEEQVEKEVPNAPSVILKQTMDDNLKNWTSASAREKYASANPYINFIKTAHDAANPSDSAPPLPHASTWFDDEGNPTQPYYPKAVADKSDDEDESELVTTSVRISIKCPITTRTLTDPVTSTVCPHSFERTAIMEFIGSGRTTKVVDRNTGRQEKAVPCPECRTLIAKSELRDDPILLRKVQRIVAQENKADGEDESDGEPSRSRQPANPDGDSSIMESGANATQGRKNAAKKVKREMQTPRLSGGDAAGGRVSATQGEGTQVIPATQVAPSATQQSMIVDLEDDDDEEEGDGEDTESDHDAPEGSISEVPEDADEEEEEDSE